MEWDTPTICLLFCKLLIHVMQYFLLERKEINGTKISTVESFGMLRHTVVFLL